MAVYKKNYEEHALLKFGMGKHPPGSSVNSPFYEEITKFWLGFTMVVYEKIYLETYINNQYIWYKNNTAQLYFTLGIAQLHWNFFSVPKDGSDIDRFSNREWALTMCTEGILSFLEKFERPP